MRQIAERNHAIKRTLETAFGRGKVRVRGSRGTAYGWVNVEVNWTPLDINQSNTMQAHCKALLNAAKIDLGHTYTDDTCQYSSDQCRISFNSCRYFRTMRHPDGTMSALADRFDAEWQTIPAPGVAAAA